MSPRGSGRTAACGRVEAETRLAQAENFAEVAELAAVEEEDFPASASVAASLAVLAGITASDAACCVALGRRSRGQGHKEAIDLLRQVEPGGPEAAKALDRLLDLKDTAHYGIIAVSSKDLRAARRHAAALVTFAVSIVRR